eukprot:340731_1
MGDSFNVSVDNDKDDTQSIAQVQIPEAPPAGLVVNYLNMVKFEHIDSGRTQPSTTSSFSCEYCGEEFQMKAHLIQHVYVNHKDLEYPVKTEQPEQSANQPEHQLSSQPEQSFNQPEQSSIQPDQPSNQSELAVNSSEHSFIETGRSINQSDQSTRPMIRVKRRKLSDHDDKIRRPYSGEGYKCAECNKCLSSKGSLIQHRQSHVEGNPHKCSECEKSFKWKISLTRHIKIHNDDHEVYRCLKCDKCFPFKHYLTTHHLRSHVEGNTHKCSECGKSFESKQSLSYHMKSNVERNLKCLVCAKSFKSNQGLSNHMKSHVKVKNLLKCSECAKSFKSNQGLSNHTKSHAKARNIFKCSECGKSLKSKRSLSNHIKAHAAKARVAKARAAKALQEQFRCTTCGKIFTPRSRLAEHQCHACLSCENSFCSQKMLEYHLWRQHYTTMLPCSECEKRFQRYTTLNSHMRRHRIEQKYFKLSPTNDSSSTRNDQI